MSEFKQYIAEKLADNVKIEFDFKTSPWAKAYRKDPDQLDSFEQGDRVSIHVRNGKFDAEIENYDEFVTKKGFPNAKKAIQWAIFNREKLADENGVDWYIFGWQVEQDGKHAEFAIGYE